MIPIPLASLSSDDGLLIGEIGAVLLFLGLASFIAAKLKFSPVPIFLVAGLALSNGGLVPLSLSDSFLHLGAQIRAILLLLLLAATSPSSIINNHCQDFVSPKHIQHPTQYHTPAPQS